MESFEWITDAICVQVGPDPWFIERGESARPAKRICADCPVRQQCLQYALDAHITEGIWGGLTPRERRAIALDVALPLAG